MQAPEPKWWWLREGACALGGGEGGGGEGGGGGGGAPGATMPLPELTAVGIALELNLTMASAPCNHGDGAMGDGGRTEVVGECLQKLCIADT